MKLQAEMAVIVASQFNIQIMNQLWLVKNKILNESELANCILTPAFVHAKASTLEFTAMPDRIQFVTTEGTKEASSRLFNICKKFIELLPHTPYTAIGMNFNWLCGESPHPEKTGRAILAPKDGFFDTHFRDENARFGGYGSRNFSGTVRLKLSINPVKNEKEESESFQASFNFHSDVASTESLLIALENWESARDYSEKLTSDFEKRVMQCK